MFRCLSKFFAVLLVLLIASPITAPFASYDLAADVSPMQEVSGAKTMTAAPLLTPFLLLNESTLFAPLADAIPVFADAAGSPLLTALRL
jgi:hypothetical protein